MEQLNEKVSTQVMTDSGDDIDDTSEDEDFSGRRIYPERVWQQMLRLK